MFYYAEIDGNYLVTNVYSLASSSTNDNYIVLTEEQYNSGDLVGKYYNSLTGNFEKIDTFMNYIGDASAVTYNNTGMMMSTLVDNMQMEIDLKADANHTHAGYASADDLALLEDVVDTKADANHTHSGYAPSNHTHDGYATQVALDSLSEVVDGKANASHTHTNYSPISHTHTASEVGAATSGHNHDSDYADINHNHDSEYAVVGHDHDLDYASTNHSHSNYATTTALEEVSDAVSEKANASHTHDDRYFTETEINTKLAGKADSTHNHNGVYDVSGAAASALASANSYTDTEIEAVNETVATKANASDLTSHTGNTTVHITSTERNNWNSAKTHANSAHAPSNAEENQNAFSNVVVNGTTIAADSKTDTLTFVAGNNVTITPDATGDAITISSVNTVYTHPTTAGNKHIPAGGSSGQILRWSADGTAVWGNDNNTTYSNATQTVSGLMSDTDKTKLDGIANGANNYTLPSAGSSLGGVKTGGDVTISGGVITVNDDSHNHTIANVDGLQSALDGKSATSHNHNSAYISKNLQFTSDAGSFKLSYTKDDNKNLLTEMANLPIGFYTIYSQSGVTGNPKTTEAWRLMFHKTGTSNGWVQAYGSIGSVYSNYLDASSWRGWKCIWDNDPNPLWSGAIYMSSSNSVPQTVTPSKKLSECRTGWLLLWSDYDPGSGANDSDFVTTVIPKNNPSGGTWGGKSFLCDIPRYIGSNTEDVDTERRIIKVIYIHDDCIKGSYQGAYDERNDVVLRAVYEI